MKNGWTLALIMAAGALMAVAGCSDAIDGGSSLLPSAFLTVPKWADNNTSTLDSKGECVFACVLMWQNYLYAKGLDTDNTNVDLAPSESVDDVQRRHEQQIEVSGVATTDFENTPFKTNQWISSELPGVGVTHLAHVDSAGDRPLEDAIYARLAPSSDTNLPQPTPAPGCEGCAPVGSALVNQPSLVAVHGDAPTDISVNDAQDPCLNHAVLVTAMLRVSEPGGDPESTTTTGSFYPLVYITDPDQSLNSHGGPDSNGTEFSWSLNSAQWGDWSVQKSGCVPSDDHPDWLTDTLVGFDTATYVDLMNPSPSELTSYLSGTDALVTKRTGEE